MFWILNEQSQKFIFICLVFLSEIFSGDARNDQFPYLVGLYNKNASLISFPICTGVIIENRHILTSARCVKEYQCDLSDIVGYAGSTSREKQDVKIEFDHISVHPEFDSRNRLNDIAIMHTRSTLNFTNNNLHPIALPKVKQPKEGNVSVVASGWGVLLKVSAIIVFMDIFLNFPFFKRHFINTSSTRRRTEMF